MVDGNHLIELVDAVDAVACAGAGMSAVEVTLECLIDDFIDQRGFTASGNAGDDRHHAQRNFDVDIFEVMCACAADGQVTGRHFTACGNGNAAPTGEVCAGDGFGASHNLLRRSLRDELTAVLARAGTDIDNLVCGEHGIFIMLDDDQRIAQIAQAFERINQAGVIALMQTDARFIEDIQHADQTGTDLRRQSDTLGFAAGERACRTGKRQIAQSDVAQKRRRARISLRMSERSMLSF